MEQDSDHWIKTKAFEWTPEAPLRAEPKFAGALPDEAAPAEPKFENPQLHEEAAAEFGGARAAIQRGQPRFKPYKEHIPPAKAVLYMARMSTGLAQGCGLFALFALRDGVDPSVFASSLMVMIFAPLLLLAGLGRMRFSTLLLWTVFASILLAFAGGYHHWRTLSSDSGHPGLTLLAMTSLFLFVGQSIAQGWVGNYPSYYRAAWRLSIRVFLCVTFAGLSWAAAGAAVGYMREQYPGLEFTPMIVPMTVLGAALAAQLTGDRFMGALQEGVMFVFVLALPILMFGGVAVVGLGLPGFWHPSLPLTAGLAGLMIISINASYRDGTVWRAYWRRRCEFVSGLLLPPLAGLAGLSLAARVQEYGWTSDRVYLAAALLMLSAYALCYAGSALISLGGGGWMQRIEDGNLALSFAGLTLIAALLSPIADPARLAVAAQTWRLDQHRASAESFDYAWLRDGGLRFGHDALKKMAAVTDYPAEARGAYLALVAPPAAERPAPTQIGANIRVHGAAGLPAGLLAQDWRGVAGAPPCLTAASLACDAFFTDLDNDGKNEIVLAYGSDARWWASVMKQGQGGGWYVAGTLAAPPCPGSLTALRGGHFSAVKPADNWRDLLVDGMRLSVNLPSAPQACPTL